MYEVTAEQFQKYVDEGIAAIDDSFKKHFDNLVVLVDDYPTAEQEQKARLLPGHLLFGLYEGVPLSRRGTYYSGVLPDRITIFRLTIQAVAQSEEQLRRIVKNTVWHEIAHFFGMNESEVRAAEKKRGMIY